MNDQSRITPVILSGGSGTRLWPMSRDEQPKQFLPLTDAATMFQLTLTRVADETLYAPPLIVANARHADLIEAQCPNRAATLVLEPLARNTAPAIALAALVAAPDAPLLVMPSDHVIADAAAFQHAIDTARPLVERGWLATFGITPDGPETGYGYIRTGEDVAPGAHKVARFVEKPDLDTAVSMLASGDYVWNGGIFMFRADAYLRALESHAPAMLAAARAAIEGATRDGQRLHPDAAAFAASPADSIDYAVMEKVAEADGGRVAVVPVAMGWSDVGSWDALYALEAGDDGHAHASANNGDVIAIDTKNCLLRTDGLRIAAVGVSDLIVVASGNDILILPRGQSQKVKQIVDTLKRRANADGLT
jgi:mannose-1-phosphate guanylyltransferase